MLSYLHMKKAWLFFVPTMVAGLFVVTAIRTDAATLRTITFPVIGSTSYRDDFGAPRVGHTHAGNDIFGVKQQPLVAAVDGIARYVPYPEPSYGWYVSIEDVDGYTYHYIHLNNDTPGTDDGVGGAMHAYAPGVDRGWAVKRGQVIGYMGDSGNAERTRPHLHFEIRDPEGVAVNPFRSLGAASRIARPAEPAVQSRELLPFGQFRIGAHIAAGELTTEYPGEEIVVGAAAGAPPQIIIYNASGKPLKSIFLPLTGFRGGVDVAVGDVNGDAEQEIVAGLGAGQRPRVYVIDRIGVIIEQFDAYDPRFSGGINVSTADLDGDGTAEIITGARRGGGPTVRTFTMFGERLTSFHAYASRFRGGVDVAGVSAGDTEPGWIITTPGPGGGPDVRAFHPDGTLYSSFLVGDVAFRGGLRVAAVRDEGTGEGTIYTIPAERGHGELRSFSLRGVPLGSWNVFEEWWVGGYDVAVMDGMLIASTTSMNRRGSVVSVDRQTTRPCWYDDSCPVLDPTVVGD